LKQRAARWRRLFWFSWWLLLWIQNLLKCRV